MFAFKMSTQKLLGIHLDEHVTWTAHIDYLCSSISTKILLLRQLAEYVPTDVQKRFNEGYILPLIDYGSITWGTTSNANIERLSKLQKRAARIILRADFDTPSSLMVRELNLLSIESRLKHNKAVLTYRALNNFTPDYISKLLTPLSEIRSLKLRSSENGILHIPVARTALLNGHFTCSAPKLWNALPQTVRNSDSLLTFVLVVCQDLCYCRSAYTLHVYNRGHRGHACLDIGFRHVFPVLLCIRLTVVDIRCGCKVFY